MTERKRTIVGFDPGTTSAIAVLDLDRNVLLLKSMRNAGFDEIVGEVGSVGKPIVVACDVSPVPDVVRKLAASFDAYLSVPDMSMEVGEKTRLARAYAPEDNHQRDSLAAALASAGRLSVLIEKARGRSERSGENWEETFEKVLKGLRPNVSYREPEVTEKIPRMRNKLPLSLKLKVLEKEMWRLRTEIESRSELILALKEENGRLLKSLDLEKQTRVRAIEKARRFAQPHLVFRISALKSLLKKKEAYLNSIIQKLRELEGKEVMVLPVGREIRGISFVPIASMKMASDKVVFAEQPAAGKSALALEETGGKKIEDWALIPKESLSRITKDRLVGIIDCYKKERTGQ